jgi:hypothetical protein
MGESEFGFDQRADFAELIPKRADKVDGFL